MSWAAAGILSALLALLGVGRCSPVAPPVDARCETPADAIVIAVGESLQDAVDAHPEGTSFLLAAGSHRLASVQPRPGNAFHGERDADCRRLTTLNGSRLLDVFEHTGDHWVARGQTQQGPEQGVCEAEWPRCGHPEDLYFDDQPLRHVDSLAELATGAWYFDYADDAIHLADDPAGHRVEVGVARIAFAPSAPGVGVVGLVVEKYATPAQVGTIGGHHPKPEWRVEDNEVRLNHGTGIRVGSGGVVAGNHVHHNGQLGVGAVGEGVLIEDNEISYNNTAHFAAPWEAGATKFSYTTGLVVRGNCVHHNRGSGLWTDMDNTETLHEDNVVLHNRQIGIFHEISGSAVIRGNRVAHNGVVGNWLYGANILISTSQDVEVVDNQVQVDAEFGNGITVVWQERGEAYRATGNRVHDNEVTFLASRGLSGAAADFDPAWIEIFESNVFDANRYHMPDLSTAHFAWNNAARSFAGFQAQGMEALGSADTEVVESDWSCASQ